ncbi:hypothetical protein M2311_005650 [Rhizobium leguminosarum]|nr:hypothetical protein [Rhizobium leguminosarum]MDH6275550.1 hypothetical protein [Rhizobium leguminosarum]
MKPCRRYPSPAACASIILNWGEFALAGVAAHCIFVSFGRALRSTEN